MMIKNHSREITELRRRSNALLPISQLPDSLLADIFDHHKKLYDTEEDATLRLIILDTTHVCHSWRAIASSYGKLWADIYPICPEQVRHWLARSANCPLDLETFPFNDVDDPLDDMYLRSSSGSGATCLALEELSRIRTLSLRQVCFTGEQLSAARWTNSSASLPLLQFLAIHAPIGSYAKHVDNTFCLTALLLLRDLPSLKRLKIRDDRFLWSNTRFPQSLTYLKVYGIDLADAWNPNMVSAVLSVLDTLPLLRSLQLSWQHARSDPIAVPAVKRQVTLSHLQELSLEAYSGPDISACLLDCLTFPSSATIKLLAKLDLSNQLERKPFMEAVAVKLNEHDHLWDRRSLRSCLLERGSDYKKYVRIHLGGQAIAHSPDKPDICVDLYNTKKYMNFDEITRMICDMLPLSEVEHLTLHTSYSTFELKPETFMAVHHNMPALQSLHIQSSTCRDHRLASAFRHRSPQYVEGLFPKLTDIHIEGLCYCSVTIGFWEFLADLLATRKERGAPVHTLSLLACKDVASHHLKLLPGLADDFIWKPTWQ